MPQRTRVLSASLFASIRQLEDAITASLIWAVRVAIESSGKPKRMTPFYCMSPLIEKLHKDPRHFEQMRSMDWNRSSI
jgi:hypothetical protein